MKKRGARILGPYEQHNGWRVVEVAANGGRSSSVLPTEEKARRYMALLEAELQREDHTTATALELYKKHLTEKGTKAQSIETTERSIKAFFPSPLVLALLSEKRCAALYDEFRTTPTKLTKKPPAVDTHRNVLSQAKSFLTWCMEQGWLRSNPLAIVKGIGKRRPRGKSLGKDGNTLRVREARAWYVKAIELATAGDEGAVAALVALLLGMRASEIVGRKVQDLDDDTARGDLLWIPCSKTPAGKRTLEVPEVLRPFLLARCAGKEPSAPIFDHGRNWVRDSVKRVCTLAGVPEVTAHAMRGVLSTLTAERGIAGHVIAATLGHGDEGALAMHAYAAPGSAQAGVNRRGLTVLQGGATAAK